MPATKSKKSKKSTKFMKTGPPFMGGGKSKKKAGVGVKKGGKKSNK